MKLTEQLLSGNSSSSITGTLLRGARMGVQAEVVELLDVLTRTVPGHAQGSTHGTQQDPEVQPQTPVIDIPSIQFEPPAEGDVLPAVDLRPARDAGLDVVSSGLLRRVMRQGRRSTSPPRGRSRAEAARRRLSSAGSDRGVRGARRRKAPVRRVRALPPAWCGTSPG
jgi:hypothetical protein